MSLSGLSASVGSWVSFLEAATLSESEGLFSPVSDFLQGARQLPVVLLSLRHVWWCNIRQFCADGSASLALYVMTCTTEHARLLLQQLSVVPVQLTCFWYSLQSLNPRQWNQTRTLITSKEVINALFTTRTEALWYSLSFMGIHKQKVT